MEARPLRRLDVYDVSASTLSPTALAFRGVFLNATEETNPVCPRKTDIGSACGWRRGLLGDGAEVFRRVVRCGNLGVHSRRFGLEANVEPADPRGQEADDQQN